MGEMPKEIWLAGSPHLDINGANAVHLAISGKSFTQGSGATLEKYHHDSIVQGLRDEVAGLIRSDDAAVNRNNEMHDIITGLNVRIATLERQNFLLETQLNLWSRRKLQERIKTLEKQLEGKIHDC